MVPVGMSRKSGGSNFRLIGLGQEARLCGGSPLFLLAGKRRRRHPPAMPDKPPPWSAQNKGAARDDFTREAPAER